MPRAWKVIVPAILIASACVLLYSWLHQRASSSHRAQDVIPVYGFEVVNTYPHDHNAWTQGLVYEGGILYESTGLWRNSSLRKVELETGNILKIFELPAQYFAEGITIFGDEIIQLTYDSYVGFVYHKNTFETLREFSYPRQGWGITHDGKHLIMSDGTSTLHLVDPGTLSEVGEIEVYDDRGPVARLNELEYVGEEIYANVLPTDRIARINPQTGLVTGWIDLEGLRNQQDGARSANVLNGIAYDIQSNRLFVTGKCWPNLFEIKVIRSEQPSTE